MINEDTIYYIDDLTGEKKYIMETGNNYKMRQNLK